MFRKIYPFLFLLFLSCVNNFAQNGFIIPVKHNGRWGYVNGNGNIKIPFIYREAGPFCEGLAAVRTEGEFEYIDTAGKAAIDHKYDRASDFINGRALVKTENRYRLIDRNGKTILAIKADEATWNGKAVVCNDVKLDRFYGRKVYNKKSVYETKPAEITPLNEKRNIQYGYSAAITNGANPQQWLLTIEDSTRRLLKTIPLSQKSSLLNVSNEFCAKGIWAVYDPVSFFYNNEIRDNNSIEFYDLEGAPIYRYESPAVTRNKGEKDKFILNATRMFTGVNGTHYKLTDLQGNTLRDSITFFERNGLSALHEKPIFVIFTDSRSAFMDYDGKIIKWLPKTFSYVTYDAQRQWLLFGGYFMMEKTYGIVDMNGKTIFPSTFSFIDHRGSTDRVTKLVRQDSIWWIKNDGQIIWQTANKNTRISDTTFSEIAYDDEVEIINHYPYEKGYTRRKISLRCDVSCQTHDKRGLVCNVLDIKTGKDTFRRQNNWWDFYDYIEVKNRHGLWKKIPISLLNSHNTRGALFNGEQQVYLPAHHGRFRTKIRVVVVCKSEKYERIGASLVYFRSKKVYRSNAIPVGINPAMLY